MVSSFIVVAPFSLGLVVVRFGRPATVDLLPVESTPRPGYNHTVVFCESSTAFQPRIVRKERPRRERERSRRALSSLLHGCGGNISNRAVGRRTRWLRSV